MPSIIADITDDTLRERVKDMISSRISAWKTGEEIVPIVMVLEHSEKVRYAVVGVQHEVCGSR